MAIIFLVFGLVVAAGALLTGAIPDPWRLMGYIKRKHEPHRFYFVLGIYVLGGALLSTVSWWADDSSKHATGSASTHGPSSP